MDVSTFANTLLACVCLQYFHIVSVVYGWPTKQKFDILTELGHFVTLSSIGNLVEQDRSQCLMHNFL